jgi:rubredoxin
MRTTRLSLAFAWTCEDCGRDHFDRAISAPPELYRAARDEGHLPPDEDDPEWQVAPEQVTCPDCGAIYRTEEA